ncbi:hypothetical protein EON81_04650 [bacterium]|nr:MAG: hypothetical protein EON81_04650 [bacterium]
MDATLARDVDEVAGSFCQIDRDVSNLDDDRSRRVVNEIIFPRLEGYGPAVKTRLMESPAGEWGAAIAVIEGKEGEADLNVGTTPTENGPCVQLEGWLRQGWRMDAGGRNTLDVLLSGFRRDRPKLEAIGILKIVGLDGKTRTLDQLDRYYQGYK